MQIGIKGNGSGLVVGQKQDGGAPDLHE